MRDTLRLGRISGIPVAVNWSVLIVALLLTWSLAVDVLPAAAPGRAAQAYWLGGIFGALLLIGSLLAHELAHAVVARRFGVEVDGVTLWMLGGVANLRDQAKTPGADFLIAAVGPGLSLILGLVFRAIELALRTLGLDTLVIGVAGWLAMINFVLGLFNLLPGLPLDGGRILRAIVWGLGRNRDRADSISTTVGQVLATVLVAVGVLALFSGQLVGGLWTIVIGWFIFSAARAERAVVATESSLHGVTVADVMSTPVLTGPAAASVAEFIDQQVLGGRRSAYPIIDQRGTIQGLVTLEQLRRVPAASRRTTPVREIALPLARLATCTPRDPLITIIGRLTQESGYRALVLEHGRLVGIVTPTDVARRLETISLRS